MQRAATLRAAYPFLVANFLPHSDAFRMPATLLAHSTTLAVVATPAIGCNSPALLQTSGALVRLCVPNLWRPLQDPLIILAPEPSVENNAHSAAERLHAVEARLTQRLGASSTTLPANWATAVTSLRASGLPAVRFASDDLTDALMAFRARRGPPSGVGLLGWGLGGLIATRALEASPPYGAACVICAPIGSTASQLEYLLDLLQLFELHFPGVLPGEAAPMLDAPTQAHVVRLLNGAPETTLHLLRTAGAEVSGEASGMGRNASSSPVASALSLLREAQAWRAQQRAAFGGRAYSNLHASYSGLGLEGDAASSVEDEAVNKAVPREAADAGAVVALREHFETSGAPAPPPAMLTHRHYFTPLTPRPIPPRPHPPPRPYTHTPHPHSTSPIYRCGSPLTPPLIPTLAGSLRAPLVALHADAALVAPYWHQQVYARKASMHGAAALHSVIRANATAADCALAPSLVSLALAQLGRHLKSTTAPSRKPKRQPSGWAPWGTLSPAAASRR